MACAHTFLTVFLLSLMIGGCFEFYIRVHGIVACRLKVACYFVVVVKNLLHILQ